MSVTSTIRLSSVVWTSLDSCSISANRFKASLSRRSSISALFTDISEKRCSTSVTILFTVVWRSSLTLLLSWINLSSNIVVNWDCCSLSASSLLRVSCKRASARSCASFTIASLIAWLRSIASWLKDSSKSSLISANAFSVISFSLSS